MWKIRLYHYPHIQMKRKIQQYKDICVLHRTRLLKSVDKLCTLFASVFIFLNFHTELNKIRLLEISQMEPRPRFITLFSREWLILITVRALHPPRRYQNLLQIDCVAITPTCECGANNRGEEKASLNKVVASKRHTNVKGS